MEGGAEIHDPSLRDISSRTRRTRIAAPHQPRQSAATAERPEPSKRASLSASLSSGNPCLHLKRPCCIYSNPCLHSKKASPTTPSRLRPPLPSRAGPGSLAGRKDDCAPAPDSFQHQTRNLSLSDPMPQDATGTTKRALRHDRLPAIRRKHIHDCSWVTDPVRRRGSWTRPPASTAPPGFLRKISTGRGSKHSACAHKPSRSIVRAYSRGYHKPLCPLRQYPASRAARPGPDVCQMPGLARTFVRIGILKLLFDCNLSEYIH